MANQSVSLNDLSVRMDGAQTAVKPTSATVVSAALQKKANHDRDITVSPVTEVGYETGGYDDPTRVGGRSHGVYTGAGVGIGVGQSSTGVSDQDRSVMETELSEKGLPEGTITSPVVGYVYFPIESKKNAHYQLEYTVNGTTVNLSLQQF